MTSSTRSDRPPPGRRPGSGPAPGPAGCGRRRSGSRSTSPARARRVPGWPAASSTAGGSSRSWVDPSWVRSRARLRLSVSSSSSRMAFWARRHGGLDPALVGLHDAGVPVRRGLGTRRVEALGLLDGPVAQAYGVRDVAALEVGRGEGHGQLDRLVGPGQVVLLEPAAGRSRRCRWPGPGRRSRGSSGSARWRTTSQSRPPAGAATRSSSATIAWSRSPADSRAQCAQVASPGAQLGRRVVLQHLDGAGERVVRLARRQRQLGVVELERAARPSGWRRCRAAAARGWCRCRAAIFSSSRPSGRRWPDSIREMYAVDASSPATSDWVSPFASRALRTRVPRVGRSMVRRSPASSLST